MSHDRNTGESNTQTKSPADVVDLEYGDPPAEQVRQSLAALSDDGGGEAPCLPSTSHGKDGVAAHPWFEAQTECAICLSDFEKGDHVRILPCKHIFHMEEVDEWLIHRKKLVSAGKANFLSAAAAAVLTTLLSSLVSSMQGRRDSAYDRLANCHRALHDRRSRRRTVPLVFCPTYRTDRFASDKTAARRQSSRFGQLTLLTLHYSYPNARPSTNLPPHLRFV